MCINIAGIKLAWTVWLFGQKIEKCTVMLSRPPHNLNLVNSRRCRDEDGKEMYQHEKRTCRAFRAFVLPH